MGLIIKMVVEVCPHCRQRYTRDVMNTDFVHSCCSNSTVIDQEDVLVIGDWVDYTGSGTVSPGEVMAQGMANKLQFSTAYYEEREHFGGVTQRGANKQTHRQRQFLKFIDKKR